MRCPKCNEIPCICVNDKPMTNDCCGGEGGYHYPGCDKPKDEWTLERVKQYFPRYGNSGAAQELLRDIKAALATLAHAFGSERELRKRCEDQLAAERKKVQALTDALSEMVRIYGSCYEQGATVKAAKAVLAKVKGVEK